MNRHLSRKAHTLSPLLMLAIALLGTIACAAPGGDEAGRSYQDIELPTPRAVGGISAQPPPAWLVMGGKAYPATQGSYCYGGACVDMIPPQMMPDLSKVTVPADAKPVILIRADAIEEFSASTRKWTNEPNFDSAGERKLTNESRSDGELLVFTLEPLGSAEDQLLMAFVRFKEGDASYHWRLNPAT